MLISTCTPLMNRLDDLKRTLNARLLAAQYSLPVEFVILDYNSSDGLQRFVMDEMLPECTRAGVLLNYQRYIGRKHYHQAHAYNLAVLSGHGEYACIMHADTYPMIEYFAKLRELIQEGCRWIEPERYKGAVCVKRSDFEDINGFDERFEFYGSDDRDLAMRLDRLGIKKGVISGGLLGNYHTPDEVKMANYRLQLSKNESSKMMRKIYEENRRDNVIRVNPEGWGRWN